ncbi:hypothetical protein M91_15046 [Bos mutus]|uniref:Uncharacterized protein n=1 Tax=Bos mutus TaxID=72004 RepID=L8ITC1_9CETA|nr:hypothetical protein M91_15046 [Bos mutus]
MHLCMEQLNSENGCKPFNDCQNHRCLLLSSYPVCKDKDTMWHLYFKLELQEGHFIEPLAVQHEELTNEDLMELEVQRKDEKRQEEVTEEPEIWDAEMERGFYFFEKALLVFESLRGSVSRISGSIHSKSFECQHPGLLLLRHSSIQIQAVPAVHPNTRRLSATLAGVVWASFLEAVTGGLVLKVKAFCTCGWYCAPITAYLLFSECAKEAAAGVHTQPEESKLRCSWPQPEFHFQTLCVKENQPAKEACILSSPACREPNTWQIYLLGRFAFPDAVKWAQTATFWPVPKCMASVCKQACRCCHLVSEADMDILSGEGVGDGQGFWGKAERLLGPEVMRSKGQTFSKCLPEQRETTDPKEEEEDVSSPEERETMDLKEEKEASLPQEGQNTDLEEEEEEITSPEEGETCERKEEEVVTPLEGKMCEMKDGEEALSFQLMEQRETRESLEEEEPISVFPPPNEFSPHSVFPPPTAPTPHSVFPPPTAPTPHSMFPPPNEFPPPRAFLLQYLSP